MRRANPAPCRPSSAECREIGRALLEERGEGLAGLGARQALSEHRRFGVDRFGPAALAFDVAGVAWEAAENADTRCWGLLPDSIQVVRMELPAGQHTLALQAVDRQGMPVGKAMRESVTVADGRNTYVVAQAPDAGIIGEVLASSP